MNLRVACGVKVEVNPTVGVNVRFESPPKRSKPNPRQ